MAFHPKRLLITGGAGFIGCNFVRHMLASDSTVRIVNLDALTYAGSPDNLKDLPDKVNGEAREGALGHASRHTFVQGDICDRKLVDRLLREHEIDTIVHFAAESHVDNSITGPAVFVQTNVMGTFTLLEAARQYWLEEGGPSNVSSGEWPGQTKSHECGRASPGGHLPSDFKFRFHHISTDEVYGTLEKGDPAFAESTPYAPNSPYSASKAGSDHLVRAYHHTYGLPVITTNCSNNYGPYQHDEKLIPTVIRACMEQKVIPVYGDGSNIRDWLYVEDHCRGIDAVIREGRLGEVYNIGGCNEWTNIDIVRLICQHMDELKAVGSHQSPVSSHEALITFVTDRPGHDWRYAINAGKMTGELDWKPQESFETGIIKTIEWYLA